MIREREERERDGDCEMRELPKQEDVGRVNQVTPLATSWRISTRE